MFKWIIFSLIILSLLVVVVIPFINKSNNYEYEPSGLWSVEFQLNSKDNVVYISHDVSKEFKKEKIHVNPEELEIVKVYFNELSPGSNVFYWAFENDSPEKAWSYLVEKVQRPGNKNFSVQD